MASLPLCLSLSACRSVCAVVRARAHTARRSRRSSGSPSSRRGICCGLPFSLSLSLSLSPSLARSRPLCRCSGRCCSQRSLPSSRCRCVCHRAAVAAGTEVGKKAKALMAAGALVGDDIVIGIIKDRIQVSIPAQPLGALPPPTSFSLPDSLVLFSVSCVSLSLCLSVSLCATGAGLRHRVHPRRFPAHARTGEGAR